MNKYIIKVLLFLTLIFLFSGCANSSKLMNSASTGNLYQVQKEINNGVNINQQDSNGYTALFRASSSGKLNIVRYLVLNGADVTKRDKWGGTALEKAAAKGHLNVVKYLLKQRGVSINTVNKFYDSPLHLAVYRSKYSVVRYLVENGANTTLINKAGFTPLSLAIRDNKSSIKSYLQSIENKREKLKIKQELKKTKVKKLTKKEKIKNQHQLILDSYIKNKDYQSLKKYTEQNPSTVIYIKDETMRLMLTGPKGMKVGDIKKHIEKRRSERIIISLIKRVKKPYKEFTLDEIDRLTLMGISDNIIAAMIDTTTEILKDEARKKEQERLLEEQEKISKNNARIIYQDRKVPLRDSSVKSEEEGINKEEEIRKDAKNLYDKMF